MQMVTFMDREVVNVGLSNNFGHVGKTAALST